jgi:hypothetical protein
LLIAPATGANSPNILRVGGELSVATLQAIIKVQQAHLTRSAAR